MAPTTRSKAAQVPAVTPAPPPSKAAGGRPKKAKPAKRPAATTKPAAAASRVQKRQKKSSPKKKQQKGKGKNKKSSAVSSAKSLSKASSRGSSKSSLKSSLKKPTANAASEQDEDEVFPELDQAYSIFPYLDQDNLQPPSTPRRTNHVIRPDLNVLAAQIAAQIVSPPLGSAWSTTRPGTSAVRGGIGITTPLPRGFELARSPEEAPSPAMSGFAAYLPRGLGIEDEDLPPLRPSQRNRNSGNGNIHASSPTAASPSPVRPARNPRAPRRTRTSSSIVRSIFAQVEDGANQSHSHSQSQALDSSLPVSINNARVFKRPTVGDVRRERSQMHDELRDWVDRLKRARRDFDAVIEEVESKMQVIRAVNRVQAPLRRAGLGRGR